MLTALIFWRSFKALHPVHRRHLGVRSLGRHSGVRSSGRHSGVRSLGRHSGVRRLGRHLDVRSSGRHLGVRSSGRHLGVRSSGHHLGVRSLGRHSGVRSSGHHLGVRSLARDAVLHTVHQLATRKTEKENCCRLGACSVYTTKQCTSVQCHFIRSHIRVVYVCLPSALLAE